MQEKIRVGIINYLNTRPLLYGLKHTQINDEIQLVEDYPAKLAQKLANGTIDVGLIPVAATKKLENFYINGKYCIGAVGDVASVCLFSQVPLQEIKSIYLDYQSRSSVALLKWLIKNHWRINPAIIETINESYIEEIKGNIAGLIIGDRALIQRSKVQYNYIYDLAGEWKAATGLPFVFAAWISTKVLPDDFLNKFNEANAYGLDHLDEVIKEINFPEYDLKKYYAYDLSYNLDEQKRKGMETFLSEI